MPQQEQQKMLVLNAKRWKNYQKDDEYTITFIEGGESNIKKILDQFKLIKNGKYEKATFASNQIDITTTDIEEVTKDLKKAAWEALKIKLSIEPRNSHGYG